jgi:hypothetical protein
VKVFWAWQYDLPGKIARHFIRGALEEAIKQINQTEDIDEPNEAFQTGAMHLDYRPDQNSSTHDRSAPLRGATAPRAGR